VSRQRRQALVATIGETIFDRDVAALDVTAFTQALAKRRNERRGRLVRSRMQEADDRHGRRLRTRGKRPCERSAAEEDDEIPPALPTLSGLLTVLPALSVSALHTGA